MPKIVMIVAVASAAWTVPAAAQGAAAEPMGPVAALALGVCIPWVAGVSPEMMVPAMEKRGMKPKWVGTRLAGFDLTLPGTVYAGVILGPDNAWCQVSITYDKVSVPELAAEIDAAAVRAPAPYRFTPVKPVKDEYGNLPVRAWDAPKAGMVITDRQTQFPGAKTRDVTFSVSRKP